MDWDEKAVGDWMKERDLELYAPIFVQNKIQGKNLSDCLEESMLAGVLDFDGLYLLNTSSYSPSRQAILEAKDHGRDIAVGELFR